MLLLRVLCGLLITIVIILHTIKIVDTEKVAVTTQPINIPTNTTEPEPTPSPLPMLRLIPLAQDLQIYLWEKCQKADLDYDGVLGLLDLESEFNINLIDTNDNGSKDLGLAQINNSPDNIAWFRQISGHGTQFNPMNPKHAIDACIAALTFYKAYWKQRAVNDIRYVYNSYNMGLYGYKYHLKKTGSVSRGYDRAIEDRKQKILEKGELP